MIVRGESTIIDYHAPFDQGFTVDIYAVPHATRNMATNIGPVVLSKSIKPFMGDVTRAVNRPRLVGRISSVLHCASLLDRIFVSARANVCVQVHRESNFLQAKLDSEIIVSFPLNEFGGLYF